MFKYFFAEFERSLIRDRVMAGDCLARWRRHQDRAKRRGRARRAMTAHG
jgi:hypothetical protein